jgi:hypothetical protein
LRGVKGSIKPVMATCHSGLKNKARGLCYTCYRKATKHAPAVCHAERKAWACGLCKSCYNTALIKANPELAKKAAEYKAGWHQKQRNDPTKHERYKAKCRLYMIRRSYGMSIEQYHSFFEERGHRCEICGDSVKLFMDHDHATGKVRGALCRYCNLVLGNAKDQIQRLEAAIDYLRKHQVQSEEGVSA